MGRVACMTGQRDVLRCDLLVAQRSAIPAVVRPGSSRLLHPPDRVVRRFASVRGAHRAARPSRGHGPCMSRPATYTQSVNPPFLMIAGCLLVLASPRQGTL